MCFTKLRTNSSCMTLNIKDKALWTVKAYILENKTEDKPLNICMKRILIKVDNVDFNS